MLPCVGDKYHIFTQVEATKQNITWLPSPFVSNKGDDGGMSQQVALFFAQKFQQVPGRYYIRSLRIQIFNDCVIICHPIITDPNIFNLTQLIKPNDKTNLAFIFAADPSIYMLQLIWIFS